jgi:thiol-disulfide isomerase/thioredoxin/outer membrane lipoprotein-sorting protein
MTQVFTLLALFIVCFVANIFANDQKSVSAEDILQKTSAKLSSLKTVKYNHRRELNYQSQSYLREIEAEATVHFDLTEKLCGARFQFSNPEYLIVFNGSEFFDLEHKDKVINVKNKTRAGDLESSSYLYGSLVTLRNILPKILADKTIPKKLLQIKENNQDFYVVEFPLSKFGITTLGGFNTEPLERTLTHQIKIDKESYLPLELLLKLNQTDFIKTSFTNLQENPPAPLGNSWYYSTYLKDYKFNSPSKTNLIAVGSVAPEFSLPLWKTDSTVSLSDYRGKLVMLDFWIYYCGACLASVPKLNELQAKYKDKNLKLLTVNIYDSPQLLENFVKTQKPEYPILHQGETIAKQYGVTFYPTVVLIGKDGKVLYSGVFDKEKIEELINKNL